MTVSPPYVHDPYQTATHCRRVNSEGTTNPLMMTCRPLSPPFRPSMALTVSNGRFKTPCADGPEAQPKGSRPLRFLPSRTDDYGRSRQTIGTTCEGIKVWPGGASPVLESGRREDTWLGSEVVVQASQRPPSLLP